MSDPKSNYVVTGYCKGKTGALQQVVSVGVVNLSDIAHWVDEWMDKPFTVEEEEDDEVGEIVRMVEVRITRIKDSQY